MENKTVYYKATTFMLSQKEIEALNIIKSKGINKVEAIRRGIAEITKELNIQNEDLTKLE